MLLFVCFLVLKGTLKRTTTILRVHYRKTTKENIYHKDHHNIRTTSIENDHTRILASPHIFPQPRLRRRLPGPQVLGGATGGVPEHAARLLTGVTSSKSPSKCWTPPPQKNKEINRNLQKTQTINRSSMMPVVNNSNFNLV